MDVPKLSRLPAQARTATDVIRWINAGGQSRQLNLAAYPLDWTDADLVALTATPHLPRLTALALRGTFSIVGMRALATCSRLDRMAWLDLSYSTIAGECMRDLANSRSLTRLHTLGLRRTRIGDVGAEALAAAPNLVSLRTLNVSWCEISDRGAKALATSVYLSTLQELDLSGNPIGPSGAEAVLARWSSAVATLPLRSLIKMPDREVL